MWHFSLWLAIIAALHYLDYYVIQSGKFAALQSIRLSPLITTFGALTVAYRLQTQLARARTMPGANSPERERAVPRPVTRWVSVCAGALVVWSVVKVANPRSEFSLAVTRYAQTPGDWFEMCRWIRARGPQGARYLTPPGQEGFVSLTERSNIAEFKLNPDGGTGLSEWVTRLRDLSGGTPLVRGKNNPEKDLDRGYTTLSPAQLRALSRKYHALYAVLPSSAAKPFRVLHENSSFALVRVTPRAATR